MGFGRVLVLCLAIQISGFIKHRAAFPKYCKKHYNIQKVKFGNCLTQLVM